MLVLLPPSEGKTAPDGGEALVPDALSAPRLAAHRRRVLRALMRVSARRDALAVLGVGARVADDVARNTRLLSEPAAPASEVYTGVLHTAAALHRLPDEPARERAERCVRTVSALWGALTPSDRIPAYRLSMATDLPGVGPLAASWRAPLAAVLGPLAATRLVVDCRSATYAAAWPGLAPAATAGRRGHAQPGHVMVDVQREVAGRRTVVSHSAKHTRGLLTRHLLTRPDPEPATPEELLTAARELVGGPLLAAELVPGRRHRLVLVVP